MSAETEHLTQFVADRLGQNRVKASRIRSQIESLQMQLRNVEADLEVDEAQLTRLKDVAHRTHNEP